MTDKGARNLTGFFLAATILLLAACGSDPKPPPKVTGVWIGNYIGIYGSTFDITANITTQDSADFSGTWSSPAVSGSVNGKLSQHYLRGSYDYYTARIEFHSSNIVECCYLLTGCAYQGNQLIVIDGKVDGNTIMGDMVYYVAGCTTKEDGSMTLNRVS